MRAYWRYVLVALVSAAGGSVLTFFAMRGDAAVAERRADVAAVDANRQAKTERTVVTAEARRVESAEEVIKSRLNVSDRWAETLAKEATARIEAGGGSAFENITEAALFSAHIERQRQELRKRNPTVPPEGTRARRDYDQRMNELNRDIALALLDPLYAQELKSGDPARVGALQAAFAGAKAGLNAEQIAAITPVVQAAFTELGVTTSADMEDPKAREVAERLNAKLKTLLSPEQWRTFEANYSTQLLFVFYGQAI